MIRKESAQTVFVRRMLENSMDNRDLETAAEMSRRIDDMMVERIRQEARDELTAIS